MNADGFLLKVSTSAMRATADTVKNQLNSIKASFDTLSSTVSRTIGYWESDAADHHRKTYASYKDRIAYAVDRINEQVNDLGVMAGVYDQAEASNAAATVGLPDDILM